MTRRLRAEEVLIVVLLMNLLTAVAEILWVGSRLSLLFDKSSFFAVELRVEI